MRQRELGGLARVGGGPLLDAVHEWTEVLDVPLVEKSQAAFRVIADHRRRDIVTP